MLTFHEAEKFALRKISKLFMHARMRVAVVKYHLVDQKYRSREVLHHMHAMSSERMLIGHEKLKILASWLPRF